MIWMQTEAQTPSIYFLWKCVWAHNEPHESNKPQNGMGRLVSYSEHSWSRILNELLISSSYFPLCFYRSKLRTKRPKEKKLLSGSSTRNIVNFVWMASLHQCECVSVRCDAAISSSTWIFEGVWRLLQTVAPDQSRHVQRIFNFILPLIRLRCQRRHTLAAAHFNWFCRQRRNECW